MPFLVRTLNNPSFAAQRRGTLCIFGEDRKPSGNPFGLVRHQKGSNSHFRFNRRNAVIKKYGILPVCLCFLSSLCWPDTLKLKNGSIIIGAYAGGSETQLNFRVGSIV